MTKYIELHAHSNFSLLDGASHPETLVARAAELGMTALALTDHDALYGAPRFAQAAKDAGIKPIFGAELTVLDHHLTLLVENADGWANLCQLITAAQHNAPKGAAILPLSALQGHTAGLIALSGCKQGEIASHMRHHNFDLALVAAERMRELFGPDNFFIELQHHLLPEDNAVVAGLVQVARQTGLRYVATNNVHYADRSGYQLQNVLTCIKHRTTLDEAGPLLRPNSEYYLKCGDQLAPLFADIPDALTSTLEIADRCNFTLAYGLQDLPAFPVPGGLDSFCFLKRLCNEGLQARYGHRPPARVTDQLSYELDVIQKAGLSNYLLIVWDIITFAQRNGILCRIRGSAANSLVAYMMGLSPIDPLEYDLVFERFLSPERQLAPDFDIDFCARNRETVIQYIYDRYGPNCAMASTFVTYRTRGAVRDVGKVLGLSPDPTRAVETKQGEFTFEGSESDLLVDLCQQIRGFPRHLGIHNGGMIITASPLTQRIPTEPASMPDRVVTQWDKDGLEDVGLVKIDILGLRMLTALTDSVAIIEESTGEKIDLDGLDFTDDAVFEMISQPDTVGVFQVESRAQAQMLPHLRPECFNDLIVAISLIRPGPIQGNMVQPYLRRRAGKEPVTYAHPLLESVLGDTYGVILFQEDVLKVARVLAGFSGGQGEQLRRALGAKYANTRFEKLHSAFIQGAKVNGVPEKVAEQVFDQLRAFGSYSFAKSHAAAFAVTVYQSAWLKHYHFATYYVAIMRSQPMGFWSPQIIINEAKRHGVRVLPVDINQSAAECTVEALDQGCGIRLGLGLVRNLGEAEAERIVDCRGERPFANLVDFCQRTRLSRHLVRNLIVAGAMDGWGARRQLIWQLGKLDYRENTFDLIFPTGDVDLPPLPRVEAIAWERAMLGLTHGDHVMNLYRNWMDKHGILGSRQLNECSHGDHVTVCALLVIHQSPPTANGVHFLTLEDSDGFFDVVVFPNVYRKCRRNVRAASVLVVCGEVQVEGDVVNVIAARIEAI